MRLDEASEQAREMEPQWDALRERRVRRRALEEWKSRREQGRSPHRRPLAVAGGATVTLAAAAAALFFMLSDSDSMDSRPTQVAQQIVGPSDALSSPLPADQPAARELVVNEEAQVSRPTPLALDDGSVAFVGAGAEVRVVQQEQGLVRLEQSAGEVAYHVHPDEARQFVVEARDVRVTVLGTVFAVEVEAEHVSVRVTRGRVSVVGPETEIVLTAGEEVRMRAEELAPEKLPAQARARRSPRLTVPDLWERSDRARRSDRPDEAAALLRRIIAEYPASPRVPSALFTLGRIEFAGGRYLRAAGAFARCSTRHGRSPLAEDCLAEEAISWSRAGRSQRGQQAARSYMERFPDGTHVQRMQRLLR